MPAVRAPRIAQSAFRKIATPAALQEKVWAEYSTMTFSPAAGETVYDSEYKAKQLAGISIAGRRRARRRLCAAQAASCSKPATKS